MRSSAAFSGWICLDKPRDLGSTPAVSIVRRLFSDLAGVKAKAGHAGTLDPFAEGVLPIALEEATKTIPFMQNHIKTYRFTVRWGLATDTDDLTGRMIAENENRPDATEIINALPEFCGLIWQKPPIFSALHVDGKRAYDLARQGEIPDLKERQVDVKSLHLIEIINKNEAIFEMICGKGTYVRAVARDLAVKLGSCGHVTRLIRTKVGPFSQLNAFSLENLREMAHNGTLAKALLPLESALDDIPGIDCDDELAQRLRQGQRLSAKDLLLEDHWKIVLAREAVTKKPIALLERTEKGWSPVRVFNL